MKKIIPNFSKVCSDLYNCEGSLLSLMVWDDKLFFRSASKDGEVKIFMTVTRENLRQFLLSKTTLAELLIDCDRYYVFDRDKEPVEVKKSKLLNNIEFGYTYFKNVSKQIRDIEPIMQFALKKNILRINDDLANL